VVLAPRDATATLHELPHIGPDARAIPGASDSLPLTSGLAVFPSDGGTVSIASGGTVLGTGSLTSLVGFPTGRPDPLVALIDKAVEDGPPGTDKRLVETVVQSGARTISEATIDRLTGVRVLWAGPTNTGRPAVVVAMTLPSGAAYVSDMWQVSDRSSEGSGGGLVPAGQLDRTLYVFGGRSGLLVVVPEGAARADIPLTGGGVQQVSLNDGGAFVVPDPAAKPLKVRAFDKDGNLIAEQLPDEGLVHL
jgi:hypothetical protein